MPENLISYKPFTTNTEFSLSDNGKWQHGDKINTSLQKLLAFFEQKGIHGGTLKIGETSIHITNKADLFNQLSKIDSTLKTLETSQASTGPTQALRKNLTQLLNDEEKNLRKALEEHDKNLQELQESINTEKKHLSPLRRIFKPKTLREAEKLVKKEGLKNAEAHRKASELEAQIQSKKELIAPQQPLVQKPNQPAAKQPVAQSNSPAQQPQAPGAAHQQEKVPGEPQATPANPQSAVAEQNSAPASVEQNQGVAPAPVAPPAPKAPAAAPAQPKQQKLPENLQDEIKKFNINNLKKTPAGNAPSSSESEQSSVAQPNQQAEQPVAPNTGTNAAGQAAQEPAQGSNLSAPANISDNNVAPQAISADQAQPAQSSQAAAPANPQPEQNAQAAQPNQQAASAPAAVEQNQAPAVPVAPKAPEAPSAAPQQPIPPTTDLDKQIKEATANLKPVLHPHIKDPIIVSAINKALQPHHVEGPANIKELNEKALEDWKKAGIIDENGTLDFTKLGFSKSEIRKAGLKGKIWLKDNGEFDMKVSGNFGDTSADALKALKKAVNGQNNKIPGFEPSGDNSPISIDPNAVKELSPEDKITLGHGGQIQFRAMANGEMLKVILDPGEDGKDDGLTIGIFGKNEKSEKIPLAVVFEGAERNGFSAKKNGHPILEDWRKQELFKKAAVEQNIDRLVPFTSRFDRITQSNEDDVCRIQAENTLWNAVDVYLRMVATTSSSPENNQQGVKVSIAKKAADVEKGQEPAAPNPGKTNSTIPEANASKVQDKNIFHAEKGPLQKPRNYSDLLDATKGLKDALSQLPHPEAKSVQMPQPSSVASDPIDLDTNLEKVTLEDSKTGEKATVKDSLNIPPEEFDNLSAGLGALPEALNGLVANPTGQPIEITK